jgi:predicted O-linked N-acetylglucosamine transferase (SPINDLY family)
MDRHWRSTPKSNSKSSISAGDGDDSDAIAVSSLVDALVATSHAEFVSKTVRLATDTAWRTAVSARVCATAHVLFDDMSSVRELEGLLLRLAKLHAV